VTRPVGECPWCGGDVAVADGKLAVHRRLVTAYAVLVNDHRTVRCEGSGKAPGRFDPDLLP
jgi:hypothetical protein